MTQPMDESVADRYTSYQEIDTGYRAVRWHEKTLYEQSRPGTVNEILPALEPSLAAETQAVLDDLPAQARRTVAPAMPEITEPESCAITSAVRR